MNYQAYLIKQATTVGDLVAIAKQNKIPLIGDWRYAANLIKKKQQATLAGQRHYDKVLGFTTPTERRSIERVRTRQQKSLKEMQNVVKRLIPDRFVRTIYKGQQAQSSPLDARTRKKIIEGGIFNYPGEARRLAPGLPNQTIFPIRELEGLTGEQLKQRLIEIGSGKISLMPKFQRTVHLHPDVELSLKLIGPGMGVPHRSSRFGHVTPGSPLDSGTIMSEHFSEKAKRIVALQSKLGPDSQVVKDLQTEFLTGLMPNFSAGAGAGLGGAYKAVPSDLNEAISLLKRYTDKGYFNPQAFGDLGFIAQNTPSTHAIFSPTQRAESVLKGSKGVLKRLYYRGLD